MSYPDADTSSSGSCWGKKEQTMPKCGSLTTRTVVSHNSGTFASMDNPVSGAQADDNGNMSPILDA